MFISELIYHCYLKINYDENNLAEIVLVCNIQEI